MFLKSSSIALIFTSIFFISSTFANIALTKGTNEYRPIQLSSYQGLPRMGEQNSTLSVQDVELHNYSLGLLSHLQFMQQFSDCYDNLKGFNVRVERCQNTLIEHNQQTQFWAHHLEMNAYSMLPETHKKAFCLNGNKPCVAKSIKRIMVPDTTNPRVEFRQPDEFEVRDLADQFMSKYFQPFENYRKSITPLKQAWFVSKINLGNYQFETNSFSFRYDVPLSFHSPFTNSKDYQKSGLQRQAFNSKKLFQAARYAPNGTSAAVNKHPIPRNYQVTLTMPRQKARDLVKGGKNRNLYALVKLNILPFAFKNQRGSLNKGGLAYQFAQPKIEIFADPELTQKVAEARLPLKTDKQQSDSSKLSLNKPKYQVVKGSKSLDSRIIPIMILQQEELKDSYFESLWRNIPMTERQYWQQLKNRQDNIQTTKKHAAQANSAQHKDTVSMVKQAEDRAKFSAFSWQNKNQMNASQRQAFYDYLLGYGDAIDNQPLWPDELSAVPWGLNLATIFRKGQLDISQEAMHLAAEGEEQTMIKQFAKEIADSQKINHLTLTFGVKQLQYQQQTKTLELGKNTAMFPVTDTKLSPQEIGNNVLYRLFHSGSELEPLSRNPKAGCVQNQQLKSRDCATPWGSILGIKYNPGEQLLALDKQLDIPTSLDVSAMTSEQAVAVVRVSQHPGWRVIVELTTPKLKATEKSDTKRGKSYQYLDILLQAKVVSMSIIDQDDKVWWHQTASQMQGAAGFTQLTAIEPSKTLQFSSPLQLNPFIEDLLLVKYAPERINSRTLDAMLSARWAYEQASKTPFGGRFFNEKRRTPSYQELQSLHQRYQAWLSQLAAKLPSQFAIPLELRYQSDNLSFQSSCFLPDMPKDAPVRNKQMAINAANQRFRKCESSNRNAQSKIKRCDRYQQDIDQAAEALEEAQANSCGAVAIAESEVSTPVLKAVEPKCDLPEPINLGTFAQDMQKCIADTCGTYGSGVDMKTYQACVQDTSAYLTGVMSKAMGMEKKPRKSNKPKQPKNTCKPAQRSLNQAQKRFEQKQCDEIQESLTLQNCETVKHFELPNIMPIERIRAVNSATCSDYELQYLYRDSRSGAYLLPDARPFKDTDVEIHFYPDALEFDYEPKQPSPTGITRMKTQLVIEVTGVGENEAKGVLALTGKIVSKTQQSLD